MADAPKFQRFVRSVEGRAVAIYGSGTTQLFGAVRDGTTIVWDTERVFPLTETWCAKYAKELRIHLAEGDLVEATREQYDAYMARTAPKESEQ